MKRKNSNIRRLIATVLVCAMGINHICAAEYEGEAHVGLNIVGGSVGISNGVRFDNNNSLAIDAEAGTSFLLFISTEWVAAYGNYEHKFGEKENRGFFVNGGPGLAYNSYKTEVIDAILKIEREETVWESSFAAKAGCGYKFAVGKSKKCGLSFSFQNNLFFHGNDAGVYWVPSIQLGFRW